MAGFVFCACQVGAERALRAELSRLEPALRPAYARPGLVTFKASGSEPPSLASSIFARAWGASLGEGDPAATARAVGATRLHVWRRDGTPAPEARAELLAAGLFAPGEVAVAGETVLDVVVDPEAPPFLGWHVHGPGHSPYPGGVIPVDVPEDAPSRAYRKLEEALVWSGAPLSRGDVALEIGSAPGGASYALLRRGLTVVGVDPGDMAPVVTAFPSFRHVRAAVGALRRQDLPPEVHWLLLDVNLAPQVALRSIRRLVPMMRPSLRGALLTLKLNELRFVDEIPSFLARVGELGFTRVRATQLPSNRQEIFVYARRA